MKGALRTTLVTGSRSGIGAAVAAFLRARGERVIGIDVADAEVVADLSSVIGRTKAIEAVESKTGLDLDAIIACAGVAIPDGPRTVSVNYFGVVEILEALAPLLRRGRDPRAVAVASSAMILPTDAGIVEACLASRESEARELAAENPLAYTSSKLALARWVRRTSVASGWAESGLLLNGLAPGLVRTAMTAPLLATCEGRERLALSAPFVTPSSAEPADLAPLIAFLASPDNRYMVGQVPFCDGGKDVLMRGDDILKAVFTPKEYAS